MVNFPIQRRGSAVLFYDLAQSLITEGHQQYTPEVVAGVPALRKLYLIVGGSEPCFCAIPASYPASRDPQGYATKPIPNLVFRPGEIIQHAGSGASHGLSRRAFLASPVLPWQFVGCPPTVG